MSCPFDPVTLGKLKAFVDILKKNPHFLELPELKFFKDFVQSIPRSSPFVPTEPPMAEAKTEQPSEPQPAPKASSEPEVESDPESELEFDTSGCIEPDELDNEKQVMGDAGKEVTTDDEDQADEKRSQAMQEFSSGNIEKAIELYGEAIKINPQSALFFSKRGQAYLKLCKPNACIKDCSRALELNCDSAPAYKFRGRAYMLLGEWEKSAKDLRQAVKIDFDEQTDEWLKEVQPNAHKIEMHNLKLERKMSLKEEAIKREKIRLAREAHVKAAEQQQQAPPEASADLGNIYKLLQDPEVLAAFQDPEVEAAFKDISGNPANLHKYQGNPKIQAVIEKLTSKFGATGGAGFGGFPGGMPPSFGANFGFGGSDASPTVGLDEDPLD